MRIERIMAVVRGRRARLVAAGALALVLAGSVVALVEQPVDHMGAVASERDEAGAPLTAGKVTAGDTAGPAVSATESYAAATGGGSAGVRNSSAPPSVVPDGRAATAPGPKVVKTANLRVEVGKGRFRAAFDRANRVAEEHGGFVASSSQASVDDKASEGSVTVRVPAERFEAARAALAALGSVEHLEITGQDVTAQIVDYDARIRNLQAQEQALSTLLSRARSVGEVLEVQGQLFGVRQQIEQLQAERNNLDAQASMATITATVFEPGAALTSRPEPSTGLARSWERAWDGAVAVVGGMVIVLGYAVPLAVLGLLAWAVWRLANRRGRAVPTPAA